jgi:hypothetical protein
MGWVVAAAGLLLLVFLIRKNVDRETTRSLRFLLKVFVAAIAVLLIGAIVSAM